MGLRTINIKGKQYIQVNERVKDFRARFADYSLETELVEITKDTALMRAVIRDPQGRLIATGTAYERTDNTASMVNKTSHVENCETSAWGRALANFGIGIDESIASAQEVANAVAKQEKKAVDPPRIHVVSDLTPPLPKPAVVKPRLIEVLDALTAADSRAKLDALHTNALKYNWTEGNINTINSRYQTESKKFPAADVGMDAITSQA